MRQTELFYAPQNDGGRPVHPIDFDTAFAALTENPKGPFPWQRRLYKLFCQNEFPPACILPTGLGKTSVLAIWLLALAEQPTKVPRRLVYVVNRRTVVDQSTDEAVKLRKNLDKVEGLRANLLKLCAIDTEEPLAISTLRGQFADNGEWRNDPARPAIIAGTVDMIGSRLLFSGYNSGFRTRPLHAGLLGCGALLIHDEAHLEPAFQKTLDGIIGEQQKREEGCLRVMQLTATVRPGGAVPFELDDDDRSDPTVKQRINAPKKLELHAVNDKEVEKLIELAKAHEKSEKAILIFARTVDKVEKIARKLKGTRTLTGTMRGHERDALTSKDDVFARFLREEDRKVKPREGTVYLVCTSAGEVGVNISADHLVCDLSTFDSMAQRLGRVNRFGRNKDTKVDVVYPIEFKDEPFDQCRKRTLELMRELNGNASPGELAGLKPLLCRANAFAPPPTIPVVSDILFDAWAMTTVRDALPGRPPVADWLHGVAPWEPPQTQVAWREEVGRFTDILDRYPAKDLLDDYPLKPHELLSDRTTRVVDHLAAIANRSPDTPVWIIGGSGEVRVTTLSVVVEENTRKDQKEHEKPVADATLILPPSAGGLSETGILDGTSATKVVDVADEWWLDVQKQQRRRRRTWDGSMDNTLRLVREMYPKEGKMPTREENEDAEPVVWRWYVRPADADDENGSRVSKGKWQELGPHNARVGELAERIAEKLDLGNSLRRVAQFAGWGHDLGKDRELWQRSIGNAVPRWPMAKSGNQTKGQRWRTGYRHEFGSLTDVRTMRGFDDLSHDEKELVLHLIAAHHGRGRPHFSVDEGFDLNGNEEQVGQLPVEVPRRFATLQRQYGRWRLAFLESILRAADYLASEETER